MIAFLSGTILAHTKDGAIVKCGSVGYEVIGTWLGRIAVDTPIDIWIYEYLENESIPRMVGCQTLEARNVFLQLLSVQGVGPKMASRIVDTLPSDRLVHAIGSGDIEMLSSVKGLGKKTAQKIVLELGKILVTDISSAHSGIIEALSALRFTPREIQNAIEHTDLTDLSESESITAVLRTLGGSS
jgi:Holliday junction DNA helicase RuvA